MTVSSDLAQLIASLTGATNGRRKAGRRAPARRGKKYGAATTALTLVVSWMMIQPGVALGVQVVKKSTQVTVKPAIPVSPQPTKPTTQTVVKPVQPRPPGGGPVGGGPSSGNAGATYYPSSQMISVAPPVNFRALAKQEALEPTHDVPSEIKSINPPKGDRPEHHFGTITPPSGGVTSVGEEPSPSAPPASATGLWTRYTVASDPASTASAGHAIDYPSVGFNKNWIVVDENVFNYSGSSFTSFYGTQIFVLDKAAAYAGTLSSISLFEGAFAGGAGCTTETDLACGFTMAPAITEDNTTDTEYIVEYWDSTAAQLRLSTITGTPSTPVLTVGTQFPQSTNSWRFDARRIGTTGGYVPQKQQAAYLTSGTRMMANDSRIQNCVLRGTTLWTTHTVTLSTTPQPAGTVVGGTSVGGTLATLAHHSGVQSWQIDTTIEAPTDAITGLGTPPIQRARIEAPTADNCHDGNGGTMTTGLCLSTANQTGTFFAFPNISVNKDNNVLIGFTQFSPLTYPNAAYATRLSADTANTTRDPVVFRPGQANYNIGAGTGGTTARQNRWGDYSSAQTDPVDDTNFWTVQEYAGTVRDFGIGLAGNWETWWALVKPTTAPPSTAGTLKISEFRLSGPQGVNDEFVELYNPG